MTRRSYVTRGVIRFVTRLAVGAAVYTAYVATCAVIVTTS